MQHLEWSDALALELPAMDDTHREFVDLLAAVNTATDESLLAHWAALIKHTDDHFGREDAWMQATRFASSNCHTMQHQVVLQVMREGGKRGAAGELAVVRQMADELAIWFPHHAQSMDAALALHLRSVGYDEQTGLIAMPQAIPLEKIEGCHGSDCDHSEVSQKADAVAA